MRTRTKPIGIPELTAMVAACPSSLLGCRDRCVLILGFGAALTRTELVTLRVSDAERTEHGLVLRVENHRIGIPTPSDSRLCPIRALDEWLQASGVSHGPIIRAIGAGGRVRAAKAPEKDAGKLVARTIQRCAKRVGFGPDTYSAHSLRAGLVSLTTEDTIPSVQRHGRWKHRANVRRYMGGRDDTDDEGQERKEAEKAFEQGGQE